MAALQALLVGMSLAASQENMLRNLEEMRWDTELSCLDNQI